MDSDDENSNKIIKPSEQPKIQHDEPYNSWTTVKDWFLPSESFKPSNKPSERTVDDMFPPSELFMQNNKPSDKTWFPPSDLYKQHNKPSDKTWFPPSELYKQHNKPSDKIWFPLPESFEQSIKPSERTANDWFPPSELSRHNSKPSDKTWFPPSELFKQNNKPLNNELNKDWFPHLKQVGLPSIGNILSMRNENIPATRAVQNQHGTNKMETELSRFVKFHEQKDLNNFDLKKVGGNIVEDRCKVDTFTSKKVNFQPFETLIETESIPSEYFPGKNSTDNLDAFPMNIVDRCDDKKKAGYNELDIPDKKKVSSISKVEAISKKDDGRPIKMDTKSKACESILANEGVKVTVEVVEVAYDVNKTTETKIFETMPEKRLDAPTSMDVDLQSDIVKVETSKDISLNKEIGQSNDMKMVSGNSLDMKVNNNTSGVEFLDLNKIKTLFGVKLETETNGIEDNPKNLEDDTSGEVQASTSKEVALLSDSMRMEIESNRIDNMFTKVIDNTNKFSSKEDCTESSCNKITKSNEFEDNLGINGGGQGNPPDPMKKRDDKSKFEGTNLDLEKHALLVIQGELNPNKNSHLRQKTSPLGQESNHEQEEEISQIDFYIENEVEHKIVVEEVQPFLPTNETNVNEEKVVVEKVLSLLPTNETDVSKQFFFNKDDQPLLPTSETDQNKHKIVDKEVQPLLPINETDVNKDKIVKDDQPLLSTNETDVNKDKIVKDDQPLLSTNETDPNEDKIVVEEVQSSFASNDEIDSNNNIPQFFHCYTCGGDFGTKRDLELHMLEHFGVLEFNCDRCNKGFIQKEILITHRLKCKASSEHEECTNDSGDNEEQRVYPKRTFSALQDKSTQLKEPEFKKKKTSNDYWKTRCQTCSKKFLSNYHLRRHMVIHTGIKRFKCERCDHRFFREDTMRKHMRTQRCRDKINEEVDNKIVVEEIQPLLSTKGAGTNNHLPKSQKCLDKNKKETDKNVCCHSNPLSRDSRIQARDRRRLMVLKSRRRCNLKNNKSKRKVTIVKKESTNIKVIQSVNSEKTSTDDDEDEEEVVPAPIEKTRPVLRNRNPYLNLTDTWATKIYPCTLCKKRFTTLYYLKEHISSTCKKRKENSVPDLHRRSPREKKNKIKKTNFDERVEAQVKKYRCSVCKENFKYRYDLNKHMNVHKTVEKKYDEIICELCDKKLSTRDYLEIHKIKYCKKRMCEGVHHVKEEEVQQNNSLAGVKLDFSEEMGLVVIENNRSVFVCAVCNARCISLASLKIHVTANHKDIKEEYLCKLEEQYNSTFPKAEPECEDMLEDEEESDEEEPDDLVKISARLPSPDKTKLNPYPTISFGCIKCSRQFEKLDDLTNHMLTHQVEKVAPSEHSNDINDNNNNTSYGYDPDRLKALIARHIAVSNDLDHKLKHASENDESHGKSYNIHNIAPLYTHCKTKNAANSESDGQGTESHRCDSCCKVFPRRYSLDRHMTTKAHISRVSSIKVENEKLKSQNEVEDIKIETEELLLPVLQTNNNDNIKIEDVALDVTSLNSNGNKSMNAPFSEEKKIKDSEEYYSVSSRFSCTVCSKTFVQWLNFRRHLRRTKHIPPKNSSLKSFLQKKDWEPMKIKVYVCCCCGEEFKSEVLAQKHKHLEKESAQEVQKQSEEKGVTKEETTYESEWAWLEDDDDDEGDEDNEDDKSTYFCRRCGKGFKRNDHLRRHMRVHEKKYQCKLCRKEFLRKALLLNHEVSVHKTKRFSCRPCHRSFTSSELFNLHKLHKSCKRYERQFSCSWCKKKFSRQDHVIRHQTYSCKSHVQ